MTDFCHEHAAEPATAMVTGIAHRRSGDRDIDITYETFGDVDGEPLLLIAGTGAQRYQWDPGFCAALVHSGYQVTRFDNRDTGASTRFDDFGRPSQLMMRLRPGAAAAYTLEDMAGDVVAVLDSQNHDSTHLVGVSLGGMIAQVTACSHPSRVRSLTSISSTPAPRTGLPRLRTLVRLAKIARAPVVDVGSLARQMIGIADTVGSPDFPVDTNALREAAELSFPRHGDLAALQRHTAALVASGDRRAQLSNLRVPTLVVHGGADRMIRPVAGRETAAVIPGATLLTIPGMGHDLPRQLWQQIIDALPSQPPPLSEDAERGCPT